MFQDAHLESDFIRLECADDGQEGIVILNASNGTGEIYFYMPKIGYPERTLLEISCTEN